MNALEGAAHAAPAPPPRALTLSEVTKDYHTPIGVRRVLKGISFSVSEGEKVAVLGRNGSGKSTLMKIIGGVEAPTTGRVQTDLFMSWPIAFSGGMSLAMSGVDNIRFIARLYNVPIEDAVAKVDDFAELGRLLYVPVQTYSSGMRMRLAFGLTLMVDFECYLIDEVIAVGDSRFQRKCHVEMFEKRAHRAMLLVSHQTGLIRDFCNKAVIIKGGRARAFEDLDLALKIYETL